MYINSDKIVILLVYIEKRKNRINDLIGIIILQIFINLENLFISGENIGLFIQEYQILFQLLKLVVRLIVIEGNNRNSII